MCLCLDIPGSQLVIIAVRLSTGSPSTASTRSMCGTNRLWGRHHAVCGRMSGHAGMSGSSSFGGAVGAGLLAGKSSRYSPEASVPDKRSSMVPPGLTRRNQRSFCLASSERSGETGYEARTCHSDSERVTSSWTRQRGTDPAAGTSVVDARSSPQETRGRHEVG